MATEPFPSWEDVLAECEATAAHAEAMLRSRSPEPQRPMPPGLSLVELTANLGAPSDEIREQAQALQRRQARLQAELAATMRNVEHQIQLTSNGGGTVFHKSVYVDRTI